MVTSRVTRTLETFVNLKALEGIKICTPANREEPDNLIN